LRSTARAGRPIAAIAVAALVLAGCGGSGSGTPGPTQTNATATAAGTTGKTLDSCAHGDATTKIVHFGGADLDGVIVGNGANGVVLAHQLHSNLCSWLPFAKRLAAAGMRVLAFDFPSTSHLDRYVLAAVAELRRDGAHNVALAGASMGGTAVLVAASRESKISRVASLSGPRNLEGLDAGRAVPRLRVPTLFVAGKEDAPYVDDARGMYRTATTEKRLLIVPGSDHGTDLLDDDHVGDQLRAFLTGG
jgi:pimeloyl-ACP methyl ester carboxylesterase